MKLFELEVSVHKMARQMKMSYKAVYRTVNTIRICILSYAEDAESGNLLYNGGQGSIKTWRSILSGGEMDFKPHCSIPFRSIPKGIIMQCDFSFF